MKRATKKEVGRTLTRPITWKNLQGMAGTVSLSDGNKKLVSNSETRFIIWSIPAIKTCPFATEHCRKACYARKAEKAYPGCIEAREKNLDFSKSDDFVPFMIEALHYIAGLKAYRTAEHITVRIHESGDFYSYEYLSKWIAIAQACKDIQNMDFAAYTKSLPYIKRFEAETGLKHTETNIDFRSSVWDDTKPERIEETKEMHLPIYTAFEKESFPETGYTKCDCKHCEHCRQCFRGEKKAQNIAVIIH